MSERIKHIVFLIATLPGLLMPFVHFANGYAPTEFVVQGNVGEFSSELVTSDPIGFAASLFLLIVFAPYLLLLISVWRLCGRQVGRFGSRLIVALAALMDLSLLIFVLLMSPRLPNLFGANWLVTAAGLALAGAAVLLLIMSRRWRVDTETMADIGIMGVFVAAVGYGETYFLAWDDWSVLGPGAYLGLYLCVVFLIRIVDVLRHPVQASLIGARPISPSRSGGHALGDLEMRIEQLERESRMLKRAGLAALVVVGIATFVLQPSERKVHDQIATRGLTIYGPNDTIQAFFEGGRDGPMLKLFNGGANRSDGLVIFSGIDGNGLWLEDGQGRETRLGLSEFKESGKGEARLLSGASIVMLNNGKLIWQAP